MYQVLARKWRPQSFEELVGQPHVARALGNAVSSGRLAHAYIFAGVRGTGKTTVARILAKCLNCERGPTPAPCGSCASCSEIAGSRSMDVLEIDAASRTKVEQTREMLELVSYAPVRDRYKILIIDEAHMLSKNSFNALLKTLEEPPPAVLFVLATTELHKILATIVSRCQVFEFRRVGPAEVAAHLRRICDASAVTISDGSLERIARAGEGSVRDSLSQLERVLAFCGERVEDEDVLRMLGAVRSEVLVEVVGALARRDAAGMLAVLDGLVDEGHDLIHFWNELIAVLRDLLVMDSLGERKVLLSRPTEEAQALAGAAAGLSREDLGRAFAVLAELESGLKGSSQPRFLFEAALIRLASLGAVRPIEEVLAGLAAGPVEAPAAAPPEQKKSGAEARAARVAPTPEPPAAVAGGAAREAILEAVRAERPMLAAILEQASAIELAGGALSVRFASEATAFHRQCATAEGLALLRAIAERLAGPEVVVHVTCEGGDAPPREPARRAAGRPEHDEPARPRPATPALPASRLLETARQEPGVKKLLDFFGAQVVEIAPASGAGGEAQAASEPDSVEEP
jgi:DNA polymerase-3 subunit gamma/tau